MKKTIKLTEKDLTKIVEKVIKENMGWAKMGTFKDMDEDIEMMDVSSDSDYYKARKREVRIPFDDLAMLGHFATNFCETKPGLPDCEKVRDIYRKYNLFM